MEERGPDVHALHGRKAPASIYMGAIRALAAVAGYPYPKSPTLISRYIYIYTYMYAYTSVLLHRCVRACKFISMYIYICIDRRKGASSSMERNGRVLEFRHWAQSTQYMRSWDMDSSDSSIGFGEVL